MKRLLLSLTVLMCAVATMAVPAHPGTVKVQQPDGSSVTLCLLGDEWRSVTATADGYSVVKDSRGFYVYAELAGGLLVPTGRVAHDEGERQADEQAFLAGIQKRQMPAMTASLADMKSRVDAAGAQRRAQMRAGRYDYSKFKGLIVLVQFNDKEFSRADYKDILTDMVNKKDYTGYEKQKMTGSVLDYFTDNSGGKFQPQFDVVGPYTVDYSQYDCNTDSGKCAEVLNAALDQVDADVNFKNYDGDGDGKVDLVFFVMAGNGANYTGNNQNLWWPHRYFIYNPNSGHGGYYDAVYKDGVMLYDYASSTELAGYTAQPKSIYIDGIGTICHEFSHVLGLPDFYDTVNGSGGSFTPDLWSLMDQGCYLNNGYTPAGYSLYESYSVGFTDEPTTIDAAGSYTLSPLHTSHTGFRIDSPESNEFFLFENRQKGEFRWDAYLPGNGMLVHRVDLSNSWIWQANAVNANPSRNYYELLRAGGPHTDKDGYYVSTDADPFPGSGRVTTLHNATSPANLKTWSGKYTKWGLFNISTDGTDVKFDVQNVLKLESLSLPDSVTVGLGLFAQLKPTFTPDYASFTGTWTSSNEAVATVDENGLVTGVSEGKCIVTLTTDDGLSASCVVTVELLAGKTIADFKAMNSQDEAFLMLKDAEVLFAYQSRAYVRDSTGAITLSNTGLTLNRNDRLSGVLYGKLTLSNNMQLIAPVSGITDVEAVAVTAGDEVLPHERTLEQLSAADYSDYVLIKGVKFVKQVYCYAVSGDHSVRVYTQFGDKGGSLPADYDGKYYDVEAIFGTHRVSGKVIDELYLVSTPVEVEAPTGIVEVRGDADDAAMPVYNLQGQRVSPSTKGLVIRGGRKLLKR